MTVIVVLGVEMTVFGKWLEDDDFILWQEIKKTFHNFREGFSAKITKPSD